MLKWEHDYNCRDSERISSLRGGRQTSRREIPRIISVLEHTNTDLKAQVYWEYSFAYHNKM